MIQVTRPFLPPIEEYAAYLKQIWDRNWLTNNGPLLIELESQLKTYLGVNHLVLMSNGTITLQALLKTLKHKGKILTTPFSYIATCSSILWEGFTPVFVDIDAASFNANPLEAEKYIDDETRGILITHCFGVPCDVLGWDAVSKKHHIPVFYDAAHAFAVKIDGKSILNYGEASSLSLHATKLYHTTEGGAITTASPQLEREMQLRRNFGHDGPDKFSEVGINGKNSELHAAMGLVNLKYMHAILRSRKEQYEYYKSNLVNAGLNLQFQSIPENVTYNYSYFPVVFPSEEVLLKVFNHLQSKEIFPRRYFYPSLNALPFTHHLKGETPIADSISKRILCLPQYHEMTRPEQDQVIEAILNAPIHG